MDWQSPNCMLDTSRHMSRHCLAGFVWGSKSSEAEFEQLGPVDGKINAQQARQKMVEAGIRAWENLILKIDRSATESSKSSKRDMTRHRAARLLKQKVKARPSVLVFA